MSDYEAYRKAYTDNTLYQEPENVIHPEGHPDFRAITASDDLSVSVSD